MVKGQSPKTSPNRLDSSSICFEGDILVPCDNSETSGAFQISAVLEIDIWPNATIPYIISDAYSIQNS